MNRAFNTPLIVLAGLALGCLLAGCPRLGIRAESRTTELMDVDSARNLTKSGQPMEAFEAFILILEHDQENLAAHRGLVEAGYYSGRLSEVVDWYTKLDESDEHRGLGAYGLALVAVARGPGHKAEALELFAKAAKARPKEPDIPYRQGLVYLMDGQLAKAEAFFRTSLAMDPVQVPVRIALARCLAETGKSEEAIETMRPILEQALDGTQAAKARAVSAMVFDPERDLPVELSTEIQKVTSLMARDTVQPALTLLNDLVVRYPEVAYVHTLRGLCNSRLGNNGEAVVAYERALELNPRIPTALVGLGDVYLRLEKWSRARKYYERALGLDPFYLEPQRRLAEMALQLGDLDRAVVTCERLVQLQPDDPTALHQFAHVLGQAGRLPEALGVYKRILEIVPDDLKALVQQARVHMALIKREPAAAERHREQARELLKQAEELAPSNKAIEELLQSLEE